MFRRAFLKIILFLPMFGFSNSKNNKDIDIWKVIEEVQEIIFPKSRYFVGAKKLGCTIYLKESFKSGFFKKLDRLIIVEGAKSLEYKYDFLKSKNKKNIIRKFVSESEGKFWIEVLSEYTLEGVFCHPLYGGNQDKKGWESIKMSVGNPEPKNRYGNYEKV